VKRIGWTGACAIGVPFLALIGLGVCLLLIFGCERERYRGVSRTMSLDWLVDIHHSWCTTGMKSDRRDIRHSSTVDQDGALCSTRWAGADGTFCTSDDRIICRYVEGQQVAVELPVTVKEEPSLSVLRVEWRNDKGEVLKSHVIQGVPGVCCPKCGEPMTPASPIDGSRYCYNEKCSEFEKPAPPAGAK